MRIRAILVDLDDTLLVEKQSADDSFLAVSEYLALLQPGIDAPAFADTVRSEAKKLWYSMPTIDYCLAIGISSREGLWAGFSDLNPDQSRLMSLKEFFRSGTWSNSLLKHGINDPVLAGELADLFVSERRGRHILFPDALTFLESVRPGYKLALITKGSPDVQREKINGSGLEKYFDYIAVSGEIGFSKPHSAIFNAALEALGVSADEAVMIGDRLKNDIRGACDLGIVSVLVNRNGLEVTGEIRPGFIVSGLMEIDSIIEQLNNRGG